MSSAANLISNPASGPRASSPANDGFAPTPLEVPVIATGARPSSSAAKRELFIEETATVLVLDHGAVIRLRETVAPGQLVFLANKVNGREVVTQVVQTPGAPQRPGFAELHFTEDVPGFWDLSEASPAEAAAPAPAPAKPAEPEPSPAQTALPASAIPAAPKAAASPTPGSPAPRQQDPIASLELPPPKQLEPAPEPAPEPEPESATGPSAETASFDGIELEMIAPGAEEVERLQQELEAAKAPISHSEPAPEPELEPAPAAASATDSSTADLLSALLAATAPDRATKSRAPAESQSAPAPHELFSSLLAVAGDETPSSTSSAEHAVGDASAPFAASPAPPPTAAPPPKPVLPAAEKPAATFEVPQSEMAETVSSSGHEPHPSASPAQDSPAPAGDSSIEALVPKPEPDFHEEAPKPRAKSAESKKAAPEKRSEGAGKSHIAWLAAAVLIAALAGGAWYANLLPFAKRGAAASPAPITPAVAITRPKPAPAVAQPGMPSAPADASAASPAPEDSSAKPEHSPAESDASVKPARLEREVPSERGASELEKPVHSVSSFEPVPDGGPVLPARLVHSVKPVYPPDAMRHYITGDIKLEGTVEPSGHVSHVTVASGPDALQSAAIDAFKQYKYQPATQDGHPVTTQVSAIIKFWFNP